MFRFRSSLHALVLFLLILAPAVAAPAQGPARQDGSRFVMLDGAGGTVWTVDPDAVAEADAAGEADLLVPVDFEKVPDLELQVLDGDTLSLSSLRGRIVLLDFWASWCTPCLVELPHLQKLHEAEKDNGLVALAVNAEEPDDVARNAARRLGLGMPVIRFSRELDESFRPAVLPLVLLVDRSGRIRERWDGYAPGLELIIARRTRNLLTGDETIRPEKIGRVLHGSEVLSVRWVRELDGEVEGLAAFEVADGDPGLAVSFGSALAVYGNGGDLQLRIKAPAGMSRIVSGDVTGDGAPDLVGFRRGKAGVAILDVAGEASAGWVAPDRVLDAAIVPQPAGAGKIVLATRRGMIFTDWRGAMLRGIPGAVQALGLEDRQPGGAVAALGEDGSLYREDTDGKFLSRVTAADAAGFGTLVPAAGRYGVGGSGIVDAVSGRFLEPETELLAVATVDGNLVLLDPDTGNVQYLARLDDIRSLAAVDLGGDGRDELAVGTGRRIAVLGTASPSRDDLSD